MDSKWVLVRTGVMIGLFILVLLFFSLRLMQLQVVEGERLTAQKNREPTVEEIAQELSMKREDVVLALEAIVEPVSLYEPVFSDGGDTIYIMDQVGDPSGDGDWLEEIAVQQAIQNLSPREKRILSQRFLEGKTHMAVAGRIGI